MAINYGAKLFESEVTTRVTAHTLGASVKAGALICMALTGQRQQVDLGLSSVVDSQGNTWEWSTYGSTYRYCAVAWTRTAVAMTTSDTITVTWNGTPSYSWKSAHSFEGASASEIQKIAGSGTSTTASIAVTVSGSDWLVFGTIMAPNADNPTLTPLNSGISRDSNGRTTRPWAECISRNGTTGSSYTFGASGVTGGSWSIVAVSFPYEALAGATARSFAFFGGD